MVNCLETERLTLADLEEFTPDDVKGVVEILGDSETAWWFDIHPIEDYDDAQDFIRWGNFNYDGICQYGIYRKDTGALVGIIQVKSFAGRKDTVELGYALSVKDRGQGYMTETVKALTQSLFEENKYLSKIRCMILPSNDESKGVATRCGFKLVDCDPLLKESRKLDDSLLDEYVLRREDVC